MCLCHQRDEGIQQLWDVIDLVRFGYAGVGWEKKSRAPTVKHHFGTCVKMLITSICVFCGEVVWEGEELFLILKIFLIKQ